MGARTHVTARRPLRCRAAAGSLPWRTNLAVVLSIAAIAGCGQAAQSPERASADRASGATSTTRGVAARPSGSADAGPTADDAATPDAARSSGRPAAADGPGTDPAARGERPQEETSGATAPPPVDATEQPPRASAPGAPDTDPGDAETDGEAEDRLDALEHTVVALLGTVREDTGAPQLQIDATLVDGARDRACAMADGTTPLLAEDDTENIGLVVEGEPDTAARAMHDWWMQSSSTRDIRMAEHYTHYGVGACTDGDRVYYSERFGP